jgi:hypothetical protein
VDRRNITIGTQKIKNGHARTRAAHKNTHVVILEQYSYNRFTKKIDYGRIIHAYGQGGPPDESGNRRVRYDDILDILQQGAGLPYTFLRFTD